MSAARGAGWRTVPEIAIACAQHRPDVPVLADPGGELTAAALLDRTRRGASRLAGLGVRAGGYVAVDTTTLSWAEVAAAYLATSWLGAVSVLTMGEDSRRAAVERIGATVVVAAAGGTIGPAELAAAPDRAGDPVGHPDDLLDIVFTSGTTGEPKPVASTHAQWTGSVRPEMMASRARRRVAHTGIPIGVSGGLHGVFLNHLARGVTSVAATGTAALVEACRQHPVEELHLTPHAARALAGLTAPGEPWAQRVRIIRTIGGPVPQGVAAQLAERFPRSRLVSLYGLTEGGAAAVVKVAGTADPDSLGRPVLGTDVRVLDHEGRELPPGQVGELAVRAAGGALAYHQDESLTGAWFPDGWARTGDLGMLTADGEVRLVGRVKELIFLRGGRLRPESVEDILARRVPAGVELAVAGLPTPGGWDRIVVFLAGPADHPEVARAAAALAAMSGPFKPQLVRVVDEIPRGPFGKPQRRLLAEAVLGE